MTPNFPNLGGYGPQSGRRPRPHSVGDYHRAPVGAWHPRRTSVSSSSTVQSAMSSQSANIQKRKIHLRSPSLGGSQKISLSPTRSPSTLKGGVFSPTTLQAFQEWTLQSPGTQDTPSSAVHSNMSPGLLSAPWSAHNRRETSAYLAGADHPVPGIARAPEAYVYLPTWSIHSGGSSHGSDQDQKAPIAPMFATPLGPSTSHLKYVPPSEHYPSARHDTLHADCPSSALMGLGLSASGFSETQDVAMGDEQQEGNTSEGSVDSVGLPWYPRPDKGKGPCIPASTTQEGTAVHTHQAQAGKRAGDAPVRRRAKTINISDSEDETNTIHSGKTAKSRQQAMDKYNDNHISSEEESLEHKNRRRQMIRQHGLSWMRRDMPEPMEGEGQTISRTRSAPRQAARSRRQYLRRSGDDDVTDGSVEDALDGDYVPSDE
jgi:hypothetical protein